MINPAFTKVNRLIVLSFENENNRTSFSKYYLPSVQIKDFNVLIDGKSFFGISMKNTKHMKQLLEWEEIIITQLVIYWNMSTFQSIRN